MPKQTFFQLPKKKKDTLIQAAEKEFSRVPLHEASVANIIKSAGIPRGSFYQYFADKEDVYFYLLDEFAESVHRRMAVMIRRKRGDLFAAMIAFFYYIIRNQHRQDNDAFFKHVFLNMNYKIENTLASSMHEKNQKSHYLSVLKYINTEKLNVKTEQELHHMIEIMVSVTIHNLVHMYVSELSKEEAFTKYRTQLALLKKGFQKE